MVWTNYPNSELIPLRPLLVRRLALLCCVGEDVTNCRYDARPGSDEVPPTEHDFDPMTGLGRLIQQELSA